ncbi:lytic transglycosylase domain-containing protein [Variovorax sp. J22G73]|uniref:lytic transglycosylase domain-containing protein n=1 Tax=unclassified Variovorax TaxID=663243 RepID=UPI0025749399|nr:MULTISPECIES: lytic transglycosylase domain-containing protein [unclassified Variovorax]MDM0007896.1 lytic transglycosylase domain-containing protein [Variovorax sp. J22R203]MDM0100481.1 lytic transglycosylase domain-containing protein [Variovorax sp. J22G73]
MELFDQLEAQYGLPSGLLDGVWSAESGRGRSMRSPKGAVGHFQFMPATAQQYGVDDPSNLAQAATGAARMYADLLKQYGGDLPRALAGYNWGQGNLARNGFNAAPAETRNYIQKVTASMGQPQARAQQDAPSDDWATLTAQFAPGQVRQPSQDPDPWAELGAKFAQPAAPARPAAPAATVPQTQSSQPDGAASRRALTATIPFVGPAMAALGISPDVPALAKGAASGFADIGNTIINSGTRAGVDMWSGIDDPNGLIDPKFKRPSGVSSLVTGQKSMSPVERENAERARSLADFNRDNEGGGWFTAGRMAGNIAATLPVGGVLAAPLRAAAPVLAPLADAVATGGFRTGLAPATLAGRMGNTALRATGGAVAGGAAAGLVNPADAGIGAAIGGILPPALQGVNKAGDLAGRAYRALAASPSTTAARSVLDVGGFATPTQIAEVQAALRAQGPNIVGEAPTVSQILQNPEISQLERTVRNTPGGAPALIARDQAQNAARLEALNRISPVTSTVQDAAANFGNTAGPQITAADTAARARTNRAFQGVDPLDETRFIVPAGEMQAQVDRFLGPGTFGIGQRANQAVETAIGMGGQAAQATGQQVATVPFAQVQNLRSSLTTAARKIENSSGGADKESAALRAMVADIDARVQAVSQGRGTVGESFPPDIVAQWERALQSKRDQISQFRTGPQNSIFRQGGDNQAVAQGAEIAPLFFNPKMSQADDIAAFQRVATPETTALLKNYAVSQAADRTDALGRLTNAKFNPWLDARSGAIGGLFDEGERATLTGVGRNLERADAAERLGMAKGSNTSQNVQNALGLGILDSRAVNLLASRTPFIGKFTGPMLDALRESAKRGKAARISGLLSDPAELDRAIADYLSQSVRGPGLLGDSQTVPFLLRSSPLLASDRS